MKKNIVICFCLLFSLSSFAFQNMAKGNGGAHVQAAKSAMELSQMKAEFIAATSRVDSAKLLDFPIQHRGRLKPFDTFAKESLLFLTGGKSFWKVDAIRFYLTLIIYPNANDLEVINVRDVTLRETFGFPKDKRYFSFNQLQRANIQNLASAALAREKKNRNNLLAGDKELIEVMQQVWLFQGISSGQSFFEGLNYEELLVNKSQLNDSGLRSMADNYLRSLAPEQPINISDNWINDLKSAISKLNFTEEYKRQIDNLSLEVFYNKAHLFLISGILYILLGLSAFMPFSKKYLNKKTYLAIASIPIFMHIVGFALRIIITEFPPVTNMYGTMIWVSFGIAIFGLLFYFLYNNKVLFGSLLIGTGLLLILTESIPLILSPGMDPIVAVLRSSYWLTIHVLTITISYGAFAISMIIGNVVMIRTLIKGEDKEFIKEYAHYSYRSMQMGVFLITVGIILGGVWADYSWGRFWGWDPKETWALIADLGYLIILHGRYVGWIKPYRLHFYSTLSFLLVIMAWYGVNFILAAGLHSYGFSSGGTAVVITYIAIQLIFLALVEMKLAVNAKKKSSNNVDNSN